MMNQGKGTYITSPTNYQPDFTVNIGNYCGISDNLCFFDTANHPSARKHDMVMNLPPERLDGAYDSVTKRDFTIGNDVWIGKNVVLMGGCEIGDGAIIGAFSVVRGKVPAYGVAIGNPAKVYKFRFSPDIIKKLLKIEWWNWEEDKLKERLNDFSDINNFVEKYG